MEAGRYKARAVSAGLGYTSGDKPQVAVELQITEGDAAGELVTWFGYFTDKTHERTFSALRTLGWQGDDLSDLTGIDANEVSITMKEEEYEGKLALKVAWINPLGGVGLKKPMTPAQAKAFAGQMKGAAVASRGLKTGNAKPAGKPTTKQQVPADYPSGDDDIPF